MSAKTEFPNTSREDLQKNFFIGKLINERNGKYFFRTSGMKASKDALILFQFDNSVIASANLLKIEKFDEPVNKIYSGAYYFDAQTIKVFEPILKEEIMEIDQNFKKFSQAKQTLDLEKQELFIKLIDSKASINCSLESNNLANENESDNSLEELLEVNENESDNSLEELLEVNENESDNSLEELPEVNENESDNSLEELLEVNENESDNSLEELLEVNENQSDVSNKTNFEHEIYDIYDFECNDELYDIDFNDKYTVNLKKYFIITVAVIACCLMLHLFLKKIYSQIK
ncbi:MAG: hypothetical protein ACK5LV_00645 [Lachnospirales bacterium]